MAKWVIVLIMTVGTSLSLLPLGPVTLSLQESGFESSEAAYNKAEAYYNYLKATGARTLPNNFCFFFEKMLTQETSLDRLFFGLRILTEFNCNSQTLKVDDLVSRIPTTISEFSELYYSASFNKIAKRNSDTAQRLCPLIKLFTSTSTGKVKVSKGVDTKTWDLAPEALELLRECTELKTTPRSELLSYFQALKDDLKKITKRSLGWTGSNSLLLTMRLFNRMVKENADAFNFARTNGLLSFIAAHLKTQPEAAEVVEWNSLFTFISSQKKQLIEYPKRINLSSCGETCQLQVRGLGIGAKVQVKVGDSSVTVKAEADGRLTIQKQHLASALSVTLIPEVSETNFFPILSEVAVVGDNKLNIVRMKVSTLSNIDDLIDSDDSECSSISFTGTESSILHVGVRTQRPEPFLFVHLEPRDEKLESSTKIHASFRPDNKLYVASLEMFDYETIRPNSGVYDIVISAEGFEKRCGEFTITFANKIATKKDSILLPTEMTPLLINPVNHSSPRFYLRALYALVVTSLFSVICVMAFTKLFPEYVAAPKLTFWNCVFGLLLVVHLYTLASFASTGRLVVESWKPVLQIFGLSVLYKKIFSDC